MPSFRPSLHALAVSLLAKLVEAKANLPLSDADPTAELKHDDSVTFDPLGIVVTLPNPRADVSAAMLYIQYDRCIFTWPHTTGIGSALAPVHMLVSHLTASDAALHPALRMCSKATTMLPVRSNASGNVFNQLPVNMSNLWLNDIRSFKPSESPGNDFAVVYIDAIHEKADVKIARIKEEMGAMRWWINRLILDLIGLLNGLMILAGMVIGILAADLWASVLFFLYACHWIGSAVISASRMVEIHKPPIQKNREIKYAIYEREVGGTVIFKAPQEVLEEWARSTWEYKPTFRRLCLHWFWIVTGLLTAIASLACMVNMRGYMQLAFLGVIVYSSLAEILATRIARILQQKAKGHVAQATVTHNNTRTKGIVRATLEVAPACRLEGLDWIRLGRLPPMPVFEEMQKLLAAINEIQREEEAKPVPDPVSRNQELEGKFQRFVDDHQADQGNLAQRIVKEIKEALEASWYPKVTDIHENEDIDKSGALPHGAPV